LLALLLASCLAAAAGCVGADDPPETAPAQRLLLIGWDGATFDLIDPLLRAGRLPNLAGLLERGSSVWLDSTIVPISSAAWTSAVTGSWPGKTGVYSFFEPVPNSYDVRPVSSHSVRAAPLWRLLSARGLRVHVIGVPLTYPPEPVSGTLVAGMLSPENAVYAYPASLTDRLRARNFVPDLGIWRERRAFSWKQLDEQLRIKTEFAQETLASDDWNFAMVVFKSLDVVSHRLYDGRTDTQVARLLDALDHVLGDLLESVGPDTNVVLMSDHGFTTYARAFNLHTWLLDNGYAVAAAHVEPTATHPGPLVESRRSERRTRLAGLELSRTRALATVSEGNFGSLRLNQRGREPRGVVDAAHRDELLRELEARLRTYVPSGMDAPVVTRVWRGEDLYPGPENAIVPDLVFETRPDTQVVAEPGAAASGSYRTPVPEHARTGILVAAGPDLVTRAQRERADVVDVAPLVLHLLGEPIPRSMDGTLHSDWLELARAARYDESPAPTRSSGARPAFSSAGSAEIRARMQALGYVD
jgi:predicted AlkP superfamily phosphohydrolase/phosphomutase